MTRHPNLLPALAGAAGMAFVGGSVAVSGTLADAPLLTVQSLRYAVACLLLLGWARCTRTPVVRPRGTQWLWLAGVVLSGMFVFNLALVHGAAHAEPAVIGVAVACVPLVLAVRSRPRLLLAALVVTLGAALVSGLGRTDGAGLVFALLTFACEAGFTLLAVPVLRTHGPLGVSVHATWMAALLFGAGGLASEGPAAVTRLRPEHVLAGVYLAVLMTAVAFVLWYTCVTRLGAARAGLFTGITPASAALTGFALGGGFPRPAVWAGVTLVAAGLALGLSGRRQTTQASLPQPHHASPDPTEPPAPARATTAAHDRADVGAHDRATTAAHARADAADRANTAVPGRATASVPGRADAAAPGCADAAVPRSAGAVGPDRPESAVPDRGNAAVSGCADVIA